MEGAREEMTAFWPAPLADFILWAIKHHQPPSTLVICATRQNFLEQLYSSTQSSRPPDALLENPDLAADADALPEQNDTVEAGSDVPPLQTHPLLLRTLHLLLSSQGIHLAFCPSVPALHAYLATYPQETAQEQDRPDSTSSEIPKGNQGTLLLGLVNSLSLHREAAAYSAQTLGKAFAAAVEAASPSGAKLLIFECNDAGDNGKLERDHNGDAEMAENETDETNNNANEATMEPNTDGTGDFDPWEDQIPILSSSTRAFGVSGERQWMDKKVAVKDIVSRWCRFRRLDEET